VLAQILHYLPLWASCLLICYSLTLLLVTQLPELLTPPLRVLLLRIATWLMLFFLLCFGQWLYAICDIVFIWRPGYRSFLQDSTGRSLRQAWLTGLLLGLFGVTDSLGWLGLLFSRIFRHPAVSVGAIVAVLVAIAWGALTAKGSGPAAE
jgi:hypothetical protein